MTAADNLADIRRRIDAAAREAGRDPAGVTLIAVSKTYEMDAIAPDLLISVSRRVSA